MIKIAHSHRGADIHVFFGAYAHIHFHNYFSQIGNPTKHIIPRPASFTHSIAWTVIPILLNI